MRGGDKATYCANFENRHRGLLQELTRSNQTQLEVIARRRTIQILEEQPLQLTTRNADVASKLVQFNGLLQIGLHQHDNLLQLGLVGSQRMPERHTLMVVLVTDAFVDEHFGDCRGQVTAVRATDQVQHHVHRRGTA
ncbi:hypothetical protein D9M68_854340 [compost metagenome]